MKADIRTKWLEALRSGRYQQGRGWLKFKDGDGERYCCLGVLCEVAGRKLVPSKDGATFTVEGAANAQFPPSDLCKEVMLPDLIVRKLVSMNDHDNSFEDIAKYIEENL